MQNVSVTQPYTCIAIKISRSVLAKRQSHGVDKHGYLFRSYDHMPNSSSASKIQNMTFTRDEHVKIWQVLRAITAAPTYFDPIKISGNKCKDAGLGYNNPVWEAHRNAVDSCGSTDQKIEVLVSVGTGTTRWISQSPHAFSQINSN